MRWFLLLMLGCPKADAPPPLIKPVFFESGQIEFATPAEDKAVVERAANILDTTNFSVVVCGLADREGDAASNKVLAQQRAEHVAQMLRAKTKVDASRIKVFALGEALADSATQGERKVEFLFYNDKGQTPAQVVENARALKDDRGK
jgi:outer membrane protein OmpA-like peptidoglycan-associated protein